jgi:O-antigen ligase
LNSLAQSLRTIPERTILYSLFVFFVPFLLAGIYLEKYWMGVIPLAILSLFIISYHIRFLFWVLIFSIACSITFDFNKRLSTDFPTEFISIGLTAIFWILWLVYRPKNLNFLWNHKLTWGLVILWIWSVIASLQAVYFVISLKYILAKIWYITSFFILTFYMVRGFRDIKKLFWMLYIPIILTAIYSFVRTVLGNFSFEFTNQYSLPFYDNHVIYATTMTLILPLVYIARRWYAKGSLPRVLLSVSIPFLLVAIYFSYTRACYLAIVGGLVFSISFKN